MRCKLEIHLLFSGAVTTDILFKEKDKKKKKGGRRGKKLQIKWIPTCVE